MFRSALPLTLVLPVLIGCGSTDPDELCASLGLVPDVSRGACRCPDGTVTREDRSGCDLPDGGFLPLPGEDAGVADGGEDASCSSARMLYRDADGDGYGTETDSLEACGAVSGYVDRSGDCDDACAACHPGADEVCDGKDNDCDRVVDGAPASLACGSATGSTATVCAAGECRVAGCLEGRRDCDMSFENGCETTLGILDACTECGEVCSWNCEPSGCNDAVDVDGGSRFSCARREDATLACWGYGDLGQLGYGTLASRTTPIGIAGEVGDFSLGLFHGCAVEDGGTVRCWGLNSDGEVGDGTTTRAATPRIVEMLGGFATKVATGAGHSCASLTNGALRCWGNNAWGQLGVSAGAARSRPVASLGVGVFDVAAGNGFTCTLMTDNTVRCWGQLPGREPDNFHVATQVVGLDQVRLVDADPEGGFACAVKDDGTVWCWGRNNEGQLGDGTRTPREIAVRVRGLVGATKVAVGAAHACALYGGGRVSCWGDGALGQLGNGGLSDSLEPVDVMGVDAASSVGCGGYHCCAVVDEAIVCWGSNDAGQLGDSTTETRASPTFVSPPE